MPTMSRFRRTPAKASWPSSVSGPKLPFVHRLFLVCVRSALSRAHRKCRTQGLATLSTVVRALTLGGLFQPPTLMGFPLQSFSPTQRSKRSFLCFLRSCAFVRNLSASYRRFSGFLSPGEPFPVCALGCYTRSGPHALLGFFGLSGSPSAEPTRKRLPFEFSLSSFARPSLTAKTRRDLRVCSPGGLASPSEEGAGLSDLLHRSSSATFLKDEPAGDYFFISEILTPCGMRMALLTSRSPSA
jgi:hypothetical protein